MVVILREFKRIMPQLYVMPLEIEADVTCTITCTSPLK